MLRDLPLFGKPSLRQLWNSCNWANSTVVRSGLPASRQPGDKSSVPKQRAETEGQQGPPNDPYEARPESISRARSRLAAPVSPESMRATSVTRSSPDISVSVVSGTSPSPVRFSTR